MHNDELNAIGYNIKQNITISKNYVSFFLVFNHITCRIERYLVNYGIPYDVKALEGINYDSGNSLGVEYNHMFVANKEGKFIQRLTDGKINSHFFQIFIYLMLISAKDATTADFKNIYDLKVINYYKFKDVNKLIQNSVPKEQMFPSRTDDINISVPKKFYQVELSNHISVAFGQRVNFVVQDTSTQPGCVRDLKLVINGKNFVSNIDLNSRITSFNNQMLVKVHRILHNKNLFNE